MSAVLAYAGAGAGAVADDDVAQLPPHMCRMCIWHHHTPLPLQPALLHARGGLAPSAAGTLLVLNSYRGTDLIPTIVMLLLQAGLWRVASGYICLWPGILLRISFAVCRLSALMEAGCAAWRDCPAQSSCERGSAGGRPAAACGGQHQRHSRSV
jgi:hypothetical protein